MTDKYIQKQMRRKGTTTLNTILREQEKERFKRVDDLKPMRIYATVAISVMLAWLVAMILIE